MRKLILIIFALLMLFIVVFNLVSVSVPQLTEQGSTSSYKQVALKGTTLLVEVADTNQKRALGLMYRENLAKNSGMLFIFKDEGIHSFWMKNTLLPLDILWISKQGKIVHIEENVPTCDSLICPSYTPDEDSLYALELNAGWVGANDVTVGDKVQFIN